MVISSEAWAIVGATVLGPVLAVGLTLWRENVASIYRRRLHVFRTLMATRKVAISNEHVNAINLIEVDFYQCSGVEDAWKAYKAHLDDGSKPEDDSWRDKRDNLLARLLYEMGVVLGFNIPAIEIYKGGYAPGGWAFRDMRATGALEYLYQLSQGKNSVPMNVVGFPVDAATAASQAEYLKLMAENIREGKPWPVEIINKSSDQKTTT